LALDILNWLAANRPALSSRIAYWLIEPSVDRQNRQRLKLENFSSRVECFAGWAGIPGEGVRGVIFSNELLDAFPVHRLRWDASQRCWSEWGVGWNANRFVWRRMPAEPGEDWQARLVHAGFELPAELLSVLPDGFTLELSPAASNWWSEAAKALRRGKLLTFDYGWTALEHLDPARGSGTLRGYSGHRLQEDVLAKPGEQDLTAHVNFTQLQLAGERAGLRTVTLTEQARFLSGIAAEAAGGGEENEPWSSEQVRQFQTLVHPGQLGRAFRVLVQERMP
jgi:SAM-dependent MidA family methyltransferase